MKQFIVPFAMIVGLIAFFVVVDREEFKRHDDVQTVQGESSTTNRKTSASVPQTMTVTKTKPPIETKTVELEVVDGTKQVSSPKSVIEAKSKEDTPPAEITPAEIRAITDTNIFSPVAVPVISAEEAFKVNEEALRLHPQKTIMETKANVAGTKDMSVPMAFPVLSPEDAIKANNEAIRFQRKNAIAKGIQSFVHKIGLNNNRIHFILSLLPLLLVVDALSLRKRKNKKEQQDNHFFSLSRRTRILFSVSLLAFGLLVFVPWNVYFGNSLQFPFIFQDFVNWNLRALTISIVGASIILLLIPPTISDYIVAIIAGLGLCVYMQAMFMNHFLGAMDGNEPAWNEHRIWGTMNLILWIAIAISPLLLKKIAPSFFSRIISFATGIVLFLECLATVSMVFSSSQNAWSRTDAYFLDGSNQFEFSNKKNILVFVFDALGSGYVQYCFENDPSYKEIFKDFTWYVDARSNYSTTFPGLCCELTGTYIHPANNKMELLDFSWNAPSAKSFYNQMAKAGFDSRLFINDQFDLGKFDSYHEYFSNISKCDISYTINMNHVRHTLVYMSGFSAAPYLLKRVFFFDSSIYAESVHEEMLYKANSSIYISNDNYYNKMVSNGITTDSKAPVFAVHYTHSAHPVWLIDENFNRVKSPLDNPLPTIKSCFKIISQLIVYLKQKGIYDNTAILIISDHGSKLGIKGKQIISPFDMSLMIKPFNQRNPDIIIDKTKVQSIDILPTLLQLACGEGASFEAFEGFPVSDIPGDRQRLVCASTMHDDIPPFFIDESKSEKNIYNCLGEFRFDDVKTFHYENSFIRYIPLDVKANVDEKVLTTFTTVNY